MRCAYRVSRANAPPGLTYQLSVIVALDRREAVRDELSERVAE